MANESQYYNPIIQSMIAAAQQQQNRAKLLQEAEQFKADKAIREHQLNIHETQINNEHDYNKELLKIKQQEAEAALATNKLNLMHLGRQLIQGGFKAGDIGNIISSVQGGGGPRPQQVDVQGQTQSSLSPMFPTGPQQPQGGGGIQFPSADEANAADIAQLKAKVGAQTTAEQSALEPFKIRDEERLLTGKKQLMDWEETFKSQLEDKKIASEEKIAKLGRDTQMAIANAANATHLQATGMQYQTSPEIAKQMVIAFATGQAKPNLANPIERAAWGAAQQSGFRAIDPKEAQALRESQQLIPLFDKLETFADKLPDTRVGGAVKGHVLGIQKKLGYTSETQNDLNNILSQALVVGRNLEGLTGGRVLSKQLELDLNSIASGGISRQDAKARLQNLRDLYVNKQENMLMGGMSDVQKDLIKNTYGIKSIGNGTEEYVRDASGKLVKK